MEVSGRISGVRVMGVKVRFLRPRHDACPSRLKRADCCGISYTSVFVCVAALAILDRMDLVDVQTLAWWLSERQLPNGGLNGRPEKLEDVSDPQPARCTRCPISRLV
jgi:hypothetical protein